MFTEEDDATINNEDKRILNKNKNAASFVTFKKL